MCHNSCHTCGCVIIIHATINKIHERSLRIVYRDNTSSFDVLLERSGSVSIHHKNLQFLAVEIYKALNKLSSPLMLELFKVKDTKYSLRKGITLQPNKVKTTHFGINSISHLAPKIWDLIPDDIKECKS